MGQVMGSGLSFKEKQHICLTGSSVAGGRLQCVQGHGNKPQHLLKKFQKGSGVCMCRHFSWPSEGLCLKVPGSTSLLIKLAQRAVRLDLLYETGGGWKAECYRAAWLPQGWFIASVINVSSMLPLTLSRDMTERQRMENRGSFHGNIQKNGRVTGGGEKKKREEEEPHRDLGFTHHWMSFDTGLPSAGRCSFIHSLPSPAWGASIRRLHQSLFQLQYPPLASRDRTRAPEPFSTPSSGPAHASQDEQRPPSYSSLCLPVKCVLRNEVGEAAGGYFTAAPSLAAWWGGQIRA